MSDGSDVVGALDALPNSDGEVSVEAIVIGIHKFVFDQSFAEFFPPKSRQMYAFECTLTDGLSTVSCQTPVLFARWTLTFCRWLYCCTQV